MSLTEKLHDANVRWLGNRVTVASELMMVASAVDLVGRAFGIAHDSEHLSIYNILMTCVDSGVAGAGLHAAKNTFFGATTYAFYRRAVNILPKGLPETDSTVKDYFCDTIRLIREHEWSGGRYQAFMGYCQEQGLYLAAKELGYLDNFRAAHKAESSVIIPHF